MSQLLNPSPAAVVQEKSWRPTGTLVENFSRGYVDSDTLTGAVTQRLTLFGGAVIPANTTISTITFCSGGTPANTPLNQWFCLVDQSLNVLAKTVDDTTTAWAARTKKPLALSATYTPTVDKPVYIGVCIVATTVPTFEGTGILNAVGVHSDAPLISATATTSPATLTNPASLTSVTSLTYLASRPYCTLS